MGLVLLTGGVRSGKSALAERLVAEAAGRAVPVTYVATARVGLDTELAGRVLAHRRRRPPHWRTEETLEPDDVLAATADEAAVLIDGVGPWLARLMDQHGLFTADSPPDGADPVRARLAAFAEAAGARGGPTVVVSEETGLGLLPTDVGTRRWVDLLGVTNQALAAAADRAWLVVAGRVLELARPQDVTGLGGAWDA